MGTIHLNLIPKSCVFKSFLHCGTNPYTDQFEIINWVCLTWIRASQVALGVKSPPANAGDYETQVPSLGQKDPLEEGTAAHCRILTWRTHGQRSLAGHSPWGRTELDTAEAT